MKKTSYLPLLLALTSLISCEGYIYEKGVVQDLETGERLQDVEVKLSSNQGDDVTITNENGYFFVGVFYGCGLRACDADYTVQFHKEGYEILEIPDNYIQSKNATFVNPEKRDTLIIKLTPIEQSL